MIDSRAEKIAEPGAQRPESQPENYQHDPQENGKGQVFMGQNFVYFYGAKVCLALAPFLYNAIAQFLDEAIAHIRHGRFPVRFQVKLHIVHDMLDDVFFRLLQFEGFHNKVVTLHELRGGVTERKARGFRFVFYEVGNGVDSVMDRSGAEVNPFRQKALLCRFHSAVDQVVNTFVFAGGDGNYRNAQCLLHLLNIDENAAVPYLVHHVDGDDHGRFQFHQL